MSVLGATAKRPLLFAWVSCPRGSFASVHLDVDSWEVGKGQPGGVVDTRGDILNSDDRLLVEPLAEQVLGSLIDAEEQTQ